MNNRIFKVNELIKQSINDIILKELSLKEGVFITIPKIDTSLDLRYTRVSVSIFPEKETNYVLKTLKKELYKIQGQLNQRLKMKNLPKIEFRLDTTEAKADKIEKLLQQCD
jgi:ribosome-binding factor A